MNAPLWVAFALVLGVALTPSRPALSSHHPIENATENALVSVTLALLTRWEYPR